MNILAWALATLIVFLDQISKFFISQTLVSGESAPVVKNIFHLTLVHNTGAAFGIFKNNAVFFTAASICAVAFIGWYIGKKERLSFPRGAGLALILGGAAGNLIDRLRFGHVIDFLDFRIWPVFNVADSAITVGVMLILIGLCRKGVRYPCIR